MLRATVADDGSFYLLVGILNCFRYVFGSLCVLGQLLLSGYFADSNY